MTLTKVHSGQTIRSICYRVAMMAVALLATARVWADDTVTPDARLEGYPGNVALNDGGIGMTVTFLVVLAFITIGATAVLYFSVSDRVWNLKAGEDAPAAAKWVAAVVLAAWTGVIVCGRMLNYL